MKVKLTPLGRLLLILVTIAFSSLWYYPLVLGVALLLVLTVATVDRVQTRVIRTAARLMLFGTLLVLPLPFVVPGQVLAELPFGLQVFDAGLYRAVVLLLRVGVAATALAWMLTTTNQSHVLHALRQLRVPAIFVSLIGMILRYLHVLGEEVRRMQLARKARAGRRPPKGERQMAVSILGVLLSRSTLRSERVYLALLARGFGRLDQAAPSFRLRRGEYLTLFGTIALFSAFTYIDLFLRRGTIW